MRTTTSPLIVVITMAFVLATAALSNAVTDLGEFCFSDNFGGILILRATDEGIRDHTGNATITILGSRFVFGNPACAGGDQVPLTGSVLNRPGKRTISLVIPGTGACTTAFWQGLITITGGGAPVITGNFANVKGKTGNFVLTPIPGCFFPLAEGEPGNPDDPNR